MMRRSLPAVLAALILAACTTKGTLDRSEVETVKVDGQLYEVRVASTEVEGDYRLLLVRGTIVIDPILASKASAIGTSSNPSCSGPARGLSPCSKIISPTRSTST